MGANTSIKVFGCDVDIGVPVFLWDDPQGFDGYSESSVTAYRKKANGMVMPVTINGRRYSKRAIYGGVKTIEKAKQLEKIRQFVVHHSGADRQTPAVMYDVLHNQRKLSVHFALEDTGVIWQFLDVSECAWHAGEANISSVGVECCLYPTPDKDPLYYSEERNAKTGNLPHEIIVEKIHGKNVRSFEMTDRQHWALAKLIAGVWHGLDVLANDLGVESKFSKPPKFPRDANCEIPKKAIPGIVRKHVGLLGHLHISSHKQDPRGLRWQQIEDKVEDYIVERRSGGER